MQDQLVTGGIVAITLGAFKFASFVINKYSKKKENNDVFEELKKLNIKVTEIEAVVVHIEDRQVILKLQIEKKFTENINVLENKVSIIETNQNTIFKKLNSIGK